MKATLLYRIAAVVLVLFAVGHTWGFLTFRPSTQEGLAVRDAMNTVHFQIHGTSFSYGDFYIGFGVIVTAYMLFAAFLAWHLARLAATQPGAIGALGWMFFASQLASFVLSWIYFFTEPIVFSAVLSACLGCAAWLADRERKFNAKKNSSMALRQAS